MTTRTTAPAKRETLNLRIRPDERGLIDRAAKAKGKNRTDFILDAARVAAENALLDQALISVDAATYTAFLERLDKPAQTNERLRNMLRTKAPWDAG